MVCINQYEFIRKYQCKDCAGIMMCACDEIFGRRFLPHQLHEGAELKTQRRVRVTRGFLPKICSECRGLGADSAPTAEIHGRTSKIKRYYWREIFFETTQQRAEWDEAHPETIEEQRQEAHAIIEKAVLAEIKKRHAHAPKYVFSELSQSQVLKRCNIEVIEIAAEHVETPQKGAIIRDGKDVISPEMFVTRRFEAEGWAVMALESAPLHALFGVMMWLLIQDNKDRQSRIVSFGNRSMPDAGAGPAMIWTRLPEDFGTEGYATRRKAAIKRHFRALTPDRDELLWLFDYWRSDDGLRQYLWAHRDSDVARARRLIEILSPNQIRDILNYLVKAYWRHYLGWPDLLLHRTGEILLLEVKSSGDRLSNDQKRWIIDNYDHLHLPFKVVKLHRAKGKPMPSAQKLR